ncbi:MAG: hypothetical protein ACUVXA_10045 [Candidatus Jordarchaeum sp.]|uniref:hypothetical protein n=1 Tax=Candidatus Jordarchaeum sp. TaxID=2823881 RepID=UPI00404B1A2C
MEEKETTKTETEKTEKKVKLIHYINKNLLKNNTLKIITYSQKEEKTKNPFPKN